ncbi:MAG: SemiSWEET family transporter [Actinomycetota bacterium]
MDLRDVFSLVCISLSFICTVPQAYRVVAHNTVEGVSATSQMQGFAGSILWIAYGIHSETYLVVMANVMTILGFGIVIAKMVAHRAVTLQRAMLVELGVVVVSFAALSISPTLLALIAVAVGSTGIIPQVIRAARTSHLTGVSVATYTIIAVMSASWFAYGVMIDDVFVSAPNVIIVPGAVLIAYRAIRSHRAHSRTMVADALPAR